MSQYSTNLDASYVKDLTNSVMKEVKKVIVGKEDVVKYILTALFVGGHVLLEGVPGVAKTLIAKTVARTFNMKYSRIQATPDLLPSDIIGTFVFNPKSGDFKPRKGPIFANIILADEINRASPRTQSALLEAMQEGQVTIEGETLKLPQPFIVIATMNPIELEGVFPLPEAQLDRFFIKVSMKVLSDDGLNKLLNAGLDEIDRRASSLKSVTSADELLKGREEIGSVKVEPALIKYLINLSKGVSAHRATKIGISPRGVAMLLRLAKALAILDGRDYVIPDDVKAAAMPALSHRIFIKPEFLGEVTGEEIVRRVLESVEVPKDAK